MAPSHKSYRDSHTAPDKGVSYDICYATEPGACLYWALERQVLADFLDTHLKGQDVHLLDFACGTGRITAFLEERVTTSVGVDLSPAMLEVARKKLKRTELIQADLTRQNVLKGRRFNLVTAFRFFANAEPALRHAAIRAIAALLAKDGYLVFNNHHNRTAPYFFYGRLRGNRIFTSRKPNVMSLYEMKSLAARAGLRVVDWQHIGLLAPRIVGLFPEPWALAIENAAMKHNSLAPLSHELIAVCRHKKDVSPLHDAPQAAGAAHLP